MAAGMDYLQQVVDSTDIPFISANIIDSKTNQKLFPPHHIIENTGIYKGSYHILGGTLPSFEGQKNSNGLLIESLVNRVKKNSVKEVILATSASIEGETTSHYISDSLKGTKVKITRLAKGVPVGGEIEFLDDGTLYSAFKNRSSMVENED